MNAVNRLFIAFTIIVVSLGLSHRLPALINPDDLVGSYQCFKPEYKHLSPLYGFIYRERLIRGLYFFSDIFLPEAETPVVAEETKPENQPANNNPTPRSATGRLAHQLFHSVDGRYQFHFTTKNVQFASHVSPQHIGTIVTIIQQAITNKQTEQQLQANLMEYLTNSEGLQKSFNDLINEATSKKHTYEQSCKVKKNLENKNQKEYGALE